MNHVELTTPSPNPRSIRTAWYAEAIADYTLGGLDLAPSPMHETDQHPNLTASLCQDGYHRPAIDIDIPCRYVPSSTVGHGHLYFDATPMTWEAYVELLEALVKAGIVDQKYLDHSIRNGMTTLRLPHIKKDQGDKGL